MPGTSHPSPVSTPSPDRRSRRSAELRDRIFRAALELFASKGYGETTVRDITNAADVGKGTFFNYFPSKDHILLAFGEMQLRRLRQAVDEAHKSDQPLPKYFRSLIAMMTAEPTRHPDVVRALLQAFLSNPDVRQAMMELQTQVLALHSEVLEIGQERGEIRNDLPAIEIAQVFRQLIFGTLLIWSLYGDASLPERMESAFEIFWSGAAQRNVLSGPLVVPLFM